MATTIYKVSSYRTWQNGGTTIVGSTGINTLYDFSSLLSNYYTKIELQTSGDSSVHFDNITEAYHNNLLDIQGGLDTSSGDSSGYDAEYYHLDYNTYLDITGISFDLSIEKDSLNAVHLVNDEDSPGNNQVYGTNATGVKGWYDVAESGGIMGAGTDNQVAVFTDPDTLEGTAGLTYDGSALNVTGTVNSTGDMTATDFDLVSDERLKQNIKDIFPESLDIEYKQFELKSQPGQIRYGIIAQELISKYPELVRWDVSGTLSVSYIDLLIREIAGLKARMKELEKLLDYE